MTSEPVSALGNTLVPGDSLGLTAQYITALWSSLETGDYCQLRGLIRPLWGRGGSCLRLGGNSLGRRGECEVNECEV